MIRPIRFVPTPPTRLETGDQARGEPKPSQQLTGDEKEMIGSSFPTSKRMSLRLYGPARPLAQAPGGIGARIDLRG